MTATQTTTWPMIVNGRRRLAGDGATLDATNPATGELLATIPHATAEDVADAVAAAHAAFEDWRRRDPREWRDGLLSLASVVEAHGDELAMLDVADNGSPIREMTNDIGLTVEWLRYYASLVMQNRGATVPTSHGRLDYTMRQPFGVVARIVPFNHPLMFAASRIGAPLAAGNTVIVKPSEHTSLSALRFAELAAEVLPPGVVNVVTGPGATTGDALVTHPAIRRIAFTGAEETGRRIVARAASVNLKTVTLELGGKNPLVVFSDADVEQAIDAAVRGMNFTWQGQSCGSTSRLIVHADIYDDVVERLAAKVDAIRSGDPSDHSTETGAIVNSSQLDKVLRYIAIGHQDGARLVAGGARLTEGAFGEGLFVRPTVFADVDPESRLAQHEIFGPVLATMRFTDYADALRIANNTHYGLTASVFTRDLATAHRYARDVEAGYVWVNEVSRHILASPFGGWKDSGLGREEDSSELESYTQVKNVHVNFGG